VAVPTLPMPPLGLVPDPARIQASERAVPEAKEPVSQVADELAEYRVELHVRASLCDRRTGRQHWNRELTDSVTYAPVTGHTLQTEEEAIERVCQHLAVALVNLTTEGWER